MSMVRNCLDVDRDVSYEGEADLAVNCELSFGGNVDCWMLGQKRDKEAFRQVCSCVPG